jgi:soluble lytic murein transglycosylase-like protein
MIRLKKRLVRWAATAAVLAVIIPPVMGGSLDAARRVLRWLDHTFGGPSPIAPLFSPTVQYWARDIGRWAAEHGLDPNLLATIMQIESCGHPAVSSAAGAQGLFQVMPFHFASGEAMLDPATNARRGASFLKSCQESADGDAALTFACYNGGPGLINRAYASWPAETRRFIYWGTGIYAEAQAAQSTSVRLGEWLAAGGELLCRRAAQHLGL